MYNVHPYFSLKTLGKRCTLYTAKYGTHITGSTTGGMCLVCDSKLHYLSVYMQREKVKTQSPRTRSHSQN